MDPTVKKKLLRRIPNGLYVMGVKSGNRVHAFTGSWLTQISMDPPAVVLGIRKGSRPLRMVKKDRVFSVNYIRKENKDTASHFFKPVVRAGNHLGRYHFHTAETGAPLLDEAVGYLECRVRRIVDGFGDHVAVIGEVVNAIITEDLEPLILADTPWHYGG